MTIDDAIAHEREGADIARGNIIKSDNLDGYESWHNSQCIKCADEHEQLAEWLEELKALRHEANEWRKAGYSHGYNKAIDDFVKACKENIMYKTFGLRECDIEQIAEQLKAGVDNA